MTAPLHSGAPFPATGAWMPGMPVGDRRFLRLPPGRALALDNGHQLLDVTIAYETWGTLAPDASNAVLLCHAWTGDSHAAGDAGEGHPTDGWWREVIGPGRAIDTDRWFVVCANVLGGCQGSTGPASLHPDDGRPYGSRFPVVTIRDMVRAQSHLLTELGIRRWHAVVGGSMGGMQVLEWAVMYPDRVGRIAPIATCAQSTAQQIAWGAIGRRIIRMDPNWRGGDYYDVGPDEGPWEGLHQARMLAQVTFRSDNKYTEKFGRDMADHQVDPGQMEMWDRFGVEGYLDYHGDKLVRRFDANSYLVISKAMEVHDVGRGRGGLEAAMARITAPTLVVGIDSDILYPLYQQELIRDVLLAQGNHVEFALVRSHEGHDAFLIDVDQVGPPLQAFLEAELPAGRA